MIDYEKFQKALKRLQEQHAHYREARDDLPRWMHEALAESVIQRFEVCYDSLWKVLKRYLTEEMGVVEIRNGPRPVIRMASEAGVLGSPVEDWFRFVDARIGTAHDYDGQKARACLEVVPDFLDCAIDLYREMTGQEWD